MFNLRTTLTALACIGFTCLSMPSLEAKTTSKKAPAKSSNKKGKAPGPTDLVHDMQKAVAYIINAAEKSKISQKSTKTRPFWGGVVDAWEGLETMEGGIKSKNANMLVGLEDTGRGVTQLAASWGMIRGAYPNSTVGRGVIALHNAYEMYNEHYGPHLARYRQKQPLSAKEKANLARSSKQLDGLFSNLKKVNSKAKPKSYQQRMLNDLVDLINGLDRTRNKGKGKLGYASYMYQWNRLQQAMWAYSEIVSMIYPEFYEFWAVLEDDIEQMDTCFGSEEELFDAHYEDWDYTEDTIEEYDDYYEETAAICDVEEDEIDDSEENLDDIPEDDEEEELTDEEEELEDDLEEEFEEELDEECIDDDQSLFDDVGESYGDDDGDGIDNEEDTDDDNDGVCDEQDADDDGDGVDDACDADTEEEEEEEMEEEDCNGIAEECEGVYDCSGGGCSDGCCGGCCGGGGCCEE
jgi:hypothetical protein